MRDKWQKETEDIQSLVDKSVMRVFYAAIRKLYGPKCQIIMPVMSKDGNLQKDQCAIRYI